MRQRFVRRPELQRLRRAKTGGEPARVATTDRIALRLLHIGVDEFQDVVPARAVSHGELSTTTAWSWLPGSMRRSKRASDDFTVFEAHQFTVFEAHQILFRGR